MANKRNSNMETLGEKQFESIYVKNLKISNLNKILLHFSDGLLHKRTKLSTLHVHSEMIDQDTFTTMPDKVIDKIFEVLTLSDHKSLAETCKKFNEIFSQPKHLDKIWLNMGFVDLSVEPPLSESSRLYSNLIWNRARTISELKHLITPNLTRLSVEITMKDPQGLQNLLKESLSNFVSLTHLEFKICGSARFMKMFEQLFSSTSTEINSSNIEMKCLEHLEIDCVLFALFDRKFINFNSEKLHTIIFNGTDDDTETITRRDCHAIIRNFIIKQKNLKKLYMTVSKSFFGQPLQLGSKLNKLILKIDHRYISCDREDELLLDFLESQNELKILEVMVNFKDGPSTSQRFKKLQHSRLGMNLERMIIEYCAVEIWNFNSVNTLMLASEPNLAVHELDIKITSGLNNEIQIFFSLLASKFPKVKRLNLATYPKNCIFPKLYGSSILEELHVDESRILEVISVSNLKCLGCRLESDLMENHLTDFLVRHKTIEKLVLDFNHGECIMSVITFALTTLQKLKLMTSNTGDDLADIDIDNICDLMVKYAQPGFCLCYKAIEISKRRDLNIIIKSKGKLNIYHQQKFIDSNSLLIMPDEIIDSIFDFLDLIDRKSLAETCRRIKNIFRQPKHMDKVWLNCSSVRDFNKLSNAKKLLIQEKLFFEDTLLIKMLVSMKKLKAYFPSIIYKTPADYLIKVVSYFCNLTHLEIPFTSKMTENLLDSLCAYLRSATNITRIEMKHLEYLEIQPVIFYVLENFFIDFTTDKLHTIIFDTDLKEWASQLQEESLCNKIRTLVCKQNKLWTLAFRGSDVFNNLFNMPFIVQSKLKRLILQMYLCFDVNDFHAEKNFIDFMESQDELEDFLAEDVYFSIIYDERNRNIDRIEQLQRDRLDMKLKCMRIELSFKNKMEDFIMVNKLMLASKPNEAVKELKVKNMDIDQNNCVELPIFFSLISSKFPELKRLVLVSEVYPESKWNLPILYGFKKLEELRIENFYTLLNSINIANLKIFDIELCYRLTREQFEQFLIRHSMIEKLEIKSLWRGGFIGDDLPGVIRFALKNLKFLKMLSTKINNINTNEIEAVCTLIKEHGPAGFHFVMQYRRRLNLEIIKRLDMKVMYKFDERWMSECPISLIGNRIYLIEFRRY